MRPRTHITQLIPETQWHGEGAARLSVGLQRSGGWKNDISWDLRLTDAADTVIASVNHVRCEDWLNISFEDLAGIAPWHPETPHCYTLEVRLTDQKSNTSHTEADYRLPKHNLARTRSTFDQWRATSATRKPLP
jgi:hypothetical protein